MRNLNRKLRTGLIGGALCLASVSAQAAPLPSWNDQMEALKEVGNRLMEESGRDDTEERRQEMYKYILGTIANGYLNHVNQDPARPLWTPLWNHAFNLGGPNPDYVYMKTLIDPKGAYRISGYRGTGKFVEISERSPEFEKHDQPHTTPATYDLDMLKIAKDGYFSVIMSADRPPGYKGDWWQLHPETKMLIMRKTAVDWRKEIDPRIAIDRLDDVPLDTPETISARFSELNDFIYGQITSDIRLAKYYRDNNGINVIRMSERAKKNLPGQVYLDGAFEIADDEALVVEVKLPKNCRYWDILVADDRFATVDWVNRQSSLNEAQAQIDGEGYLRAVISARDPGVPNWLDTAGERWGIMQMRWNRCSSAPEPEVKRVALQDVRKYLPANTPNVTPAERREQLRLRREAAQFRQLW